MMPTPLCLLADKYGSDKSPTKERHAYTLLYHEMFAEQRERVRCVLEIGAGYRALMGGGNYVDCASIYMWREYFRNAHIFCAEIQPGLAREEERLSVIRCDQSSLAQLRALCEDKIRQPIDIIIDDGSHEAAHQLISLYTLFPYLRAGGTYIVEDIQQRDLFRVFPHPRELLREYRITPEGAQYVADNVASQREVFGDGAAYGYKSLEGDHLFIVEKTTTETPLKPSQSGGHGMLLNERGEHCGLDGVCFVLPNKSGGYNASMLGPNGFEEHAVIEWAKQFGVKDKIFIDVGAHIGTYTLSLAPLFREVHAFEPQLMKFYALCGGIALNEYINVRPYNLALGTHEEHGTHKDLLSIKGDGAGSGTTFDPEVISKHPGGLLRADSVELRSLDSFDFHDVGLLKVDVETWEENVMRGAEEMLLREHPPILFESWNFPWFLPRRESLFAYLRGLGYKIFPIRGHDIMWLANMG